MYPNDVIISQIDAPVSLDQTSQSVIEIGEVDPLTEDVKGSDKTIERIASQEVICFDKRLYVLV